MNRFKFFALPAALLIWLGTNLFFAKTNQELFAELQEEKADIVVNYAVDAAVEEVVQARNSTEYVLHNIFKRYRDDRNGE